MFIFSFIQNFIFKNIKHIWDIRLYIESGNEDSGLMASVIILLYEFLTINVIQYYEFNRSLQNKYHRDINT